MENYLLGSAILSVLVGVFKKELGILITVYGIYRQMKKADKDPDTPDKIEIQSPATGEWAQVLVQKYVFSISKSKRGVFIEHSVGNKKSIQVFKFIDWENVSKRSIPSFN